MIGFADRFPGQLEVAGTRVQPGDADLPLPGDFHPGDPVVAQAEVADGEGRFDHGHASRLQPDLRKHGGRNRGGR